MSTNFRDTTLDYIPQTTVHIWGLGYHVLVLKLWQYDIRGVPFTVATKTVYITLVPPIPAAPTLSVGSTGGPYNHPVLSWNDIGYYSVHQNTTNGYEIYRRDYEGQTLRIDWRKIASVSGTSTTWTDASLHGAPMGLDRVDYEVHAVDIANQVSPFSNVCTTKVFIYRKISPGSVPNQFALKQAYPNPFNPSTHLQFDLPGPGNVSLQILDVQGREIQTLHSGFAEVGSYDVTWNASNQATGIYFARLVVTGQLGKVLYSKTNKLLLAK